MSVHSQICPLLSILLCVSGLSLPNYISQVPLPLSLGPVGSTGWEPEGRSQGTLSPTPCFHGILGSGWVTSMVPGPGNRPSFQVSALVGSPCTTTVQVPTNNPDSQALSSSFVPGPLDLRKCRSPVPACQCHASLLLRPYSSSSIFRTNALCYIPSIEIPVLVS